MKMITKQRILATAILITASVTITQEATSAPVGLVAECAQLRSDASYYGDLHQEIRSDIRYQEASRVVLQVSVSFLLAHVDEDPTLYEDLAKALIQIQAIDVTIAELEEAEDYYYGVTLDILSDISKRCKPYGL